MTSSRALRATLAGGVALVLAGGFGFSGAPAAEVTVSPSSPPPQCPSTTELLPSGEGPPEGCEDPDEGGAAPPSPSPKPTQPAPPTPSPPGQPGSGEPTPDQTPDQAPQSPGDQPPPPAEPPPPAPKNTGGVGAASLAGALGALTMPGGFEEETAPQEFRGPDVAAPPPLAAAPMIGGEFDPLLDYADDMEPLLADDDLEPGEAEAIVPTNDRTFLETLMSAVDGPQATKSLAFMLVLLLVAGHVRGFLRSPTGDPTLD